MVALRVGDHSKRTAEAFPVVASLPPKDREATTGNASAVHGLRRPRNKRNAGSCWLKTLNGFNLCATTPDRMCKRTQHVSSNNNVASVGLFTVPYFFVRSFRYTASYRHGYLDFQVYRGGRRRGL